jgi:hypothetical protein
VVADFHRRLVEIAVVNKVVAGRRMRVDTTVVETNIHYLNGYIGGLATPGGLVMFLPVRLGKPIRSPVVLGQVSEKFREAVKAQAERQRIPISSRIKSERTISRTNSGDSEEYGMRSSSSAWRRRRQKR